VSSLGDDIEAIECLKWWLRVVISSGDLKDIADAKNMLVDMQTKRRSYNCEWGRLANEQRVLFVCMLSCSYYSIAKRSAHR
jgi:hypothetical protein